MNSTVIDQFRSTLRGELIQPQDVEYDAARKVYNGMIDRRPRFIVRCSDVADVISAVKFAKENDLRLAIRGGGHNGAGLAVCDDGLVIDLSRRRGVRVNPKQRTVQAEGGCTWGDVDHAAHAFNLAVPAGIVSTTGVAGLTLGGGTGYLTRKFGLTIDNLLEADMVLADGSFVTVSQSENNDLYWAIRGGGGNFGVVTSFTFRAHPVSTVYAGPMLWHPDKAVEVMKWYREFSLKAPEDLYGFFMFGNVPPAPPFPEKLHGKTMCGIVWCYTGPMENAKNALSPVDQLSPPELNFVGPMPFPALQSLFDPLLPPGLQWYWRGDFMNELSDEAIKVHLKYGLNLPSLLSIMHIYPVDGAVQRVSKNATAFSYREAKWSMVIAGIDPDPAKKDAITKWTKEYWEALHPFSAGGAYVNFMMEEGQSRVEATYRDNYKRLTEIKRKYDPTNLFRVNQNIQPAK
ncbi:MAG TPA: FAD-binding oxidoreductase [Methylomirabilota bacterium]|nr:FAD-binding oxidoreductase [Methylomirabilota bacterium]